jgi:hypothetical protein
MNRVVRIVLIVVGIASGYYLIRLVGLYFAERRRPEAFPAERADDLLNPLRAVFMPARKTLAHFDLGPGQTVLEIGPGRDTTRSRQAVGWGNLESCCAATFSAG